MPTPGNACDLSVWVAKLNPRFYTISEFRGVVSLPHQPFLSTDLLELLTRKLTQASDSHILHAVTPSTASSRPAPTIIAAHDQFVLQNAPAPPRTAVHHQPPQSFGIQDCSLIVPGCEAPSSPSAPYHEGHPSGEDPEKACGSLQKRSGPRK